MPCPDCHDGRVMFEPLDVAPGRITGSCNVCGHWFRLHGGDLTPVPGHAPSQSPQH